MCADYTFIFQCLYCTSTSTYFFGVGTMKEASFIVQPANTLRTVQVQVTCRNCTIQRDNIILFSEYIKTDQNLYMYKYRTVGGKRSKSSRDTCSRSFKLVYLRSMVDNTIYIFYHWVNIFESYFIDYINMLKTCSLYWENRRCSIFILWRSLTESHQEVWGRKICSRNQWQ